MSDFESQLAELIRREPSGRLLLSSLGASEAVRLAQRNLLWSRETGLAKFLRSFARFQVVDNNFVCFSNPAHVSPSTNMAARNNNNNNHSAAAPPPPPKQAANQAPNPRKMRVFAATSSAPANNIHNNNNNNNVVRAKEEDDFDFEIVPTLTDKLKRLSVLGGVGGNVNTQQQSSAAHFDARSYFFDYHSSWSDSSGTSSDTAERDTTLLGESSIKHSSSNAKTTPALKYGLLGVDIEDSEPIFLNTTNPFCVVSVGVQGSGKSHSSAVVIESCALANYGQVTHTASQPSAVLILHYDTDESCFCEAATLTSPALAGANLPVVRDMVILVSPSFYKQRARFYANWPHCRVKPLLFKWRQMTAATIKTLMCVSSGEEPPLYMACLLDLLRKLQKRDSFPTFEAFKAQLAEQGFSKLQSTPLAQRLRLIESLMAESAENADIQHEFVDLAGLCKPGTVVIADLTDPMMTAGEARAIFGVLVERFKNIQLRCDKMLVCDEAHKYLQSSGDQLTGAIVELVRQMRHHGMRIVVSSQSPMTLPDELFELATVCIMHQFHSEDWFRRLRAKLPLAANAFERIVEQRTGEATVFCSRWDSTFEKFDHLGPGVRQVKIRPRITCDGGRSMIALGDGRRQ